MTKADLKALLVLRNAYSIGSEKYIVAYAKKLAPALSEEQIQEVVQNYLADGS